MNSRSFLRLASPVVLVAVFLTLQGSVCYGQATELTRHPGYADFDVIPRTIKAEPKVEVYIKGALLRLAAEATRTEDPDLANMLLGLKAIRVFAYDESTAGEALQRDLETTARQISSDLERGGWDVVARVRDDEERVHVLIRDIDDIVQGMVVVAINDEEAVFVNITGTLDPAEIGRIGSRFDIDVLEDVRVQR